MDLRQPGLLLPGILGLALVVLVVWLLLRRRHDSGTVPVANSELLRQLPEYQQAIRAYRLRALVVAAVAAIVGVIAIVGAARPVQRQLVNPEKVNRDVVLCLDVSGSMIDVDAEVVGTFRRLAAGFQGQRLSMVIFNSSAVPVFPLTDDYAFVDEQLRQAQRALDTLDPKDPFFAGTLNGAGSSLIGDGLATCLRGFDHPELTRARSVILASDNEAAGKSLFTLPEAGQLASTGAIQIYGINPTDSPGSSAAREMRTVVESSGGIYYALTDVSAVKGILSAVNAREATRIPAAPVLTIRDQPGWPMALAGAGLLGLLAVRRLRWRP